MTGRATSNRVQTLVLHTDRERGTYCEAAPLGLVWVVSGYYLDRDAFEMRPLTVRHLVWYLVRNQAVWAWWRIVRMAWRAGFLGTQEGCRYSWRDWRIPPWLTSWFRGALRRSASWAMWDPDGNLRQPPEDDDD